MGIKTSLVSVEVMISAGLPKFAIVGLPDKAISEARERITSAFLSMGLALPPKKIIVNLAPADVLKEGSHFDLPIALAILGALDIVPSEEVANYLVMGELSLSGHIKPVNGILPAAIGAKDAGLGIICPAAQAGEALWSGNENSLGANTLSEIVNHFKGSQLIARAVMPSAFDVKHSVDMRDIKGQNQARRALEIAAVGCHHMLMIGPPGVGKSMLASRLPTILPPMNAKEMLELSVINSVAGMKMEEGLCISRPFRAPHHTASQASLTGGGMHAKPGEASLAHNGVLFLDELPEFYTASLDSLRQPLENGEITIARANAHITYPAKFQLVAAMNPCKCGHFGNPNKACASAPLCALKYQNRISGPMYDRIDLVVEVENLNPWELNTIEPSEDSATIRARVIRAREFEMERLRRHFGTDGLLNAGLSGKQIEESANMSPDAHSMLIKAAEKFGLSARGYYKIMRIARTVADMRFSDSLDTPDVSEALMFRRKVG